MRVTGSSQNLINGVSRQPPEIRLTSQLEESVNQFPTTSRGLVRRNPAVLKGIIQSPKPFAAKTHLIDRDAFERYVVTISSSGVTVHDLEGNQKQVNAPNGWGYLQDATDTDIEAMTVADHTFILNKRKVVRPAAAWSPKEERSGLIHIVQGDYQTDYDIVVNGLSVAAYKTDGGSYSDEYDARCAERGAKTRIIASRLAFADPNNNRDFLPRQSDRCLATSLPAPEWYVELLDNVIYLKNNYGNDFSLKADAGSENRMRAHKSVTTDYSNLPKKAPDGFRIKVTGSKDTSFDDYYVRFDKPSTAAEGRWKETLAPDIPFKFDASTMPHILVREADGSFTFKEAFWADREVGDLETNPWPSFVDHTISGMVFFKNRIGFISGENCAMSRHNDFFNFFIESILTPLDTDPIDISISYPEISNINYAVPFSGEMIMFTTSVPFRMASGETFTPKSASFEHLLSNSVSSKVRPVAAGSRLFFVNDVESGCFVHELLYDRDVGVKDAPCVSEHVQGYIPSGIKLMEGEEDLNILCLISDLEPRTIYVYKWLWMGQQKAQSAWQKWTIQNPILGFKFFGEELILVTDCGQTREILSINCHESWEDYGSTIYLDRRTFSYGQYNDQDKTTEFTVPYYADGSTVVLKDTDNYGLQPKILYYNDRRIVVEGCWPKPAYVGFNFDSYGVLSPLLHRTTNNQGDYGNAVAGVRTTIANLAIQTAKSVYLDVELSRAYRPAYKYHFSAALLGTKTGSVGKLIIGDVDKTISVMANSSDVGITFRNSGAFGYSVLGYRWTGRATQMFY